MKILLRGARVFEDHALKRMDVSISGGRIAELSPDISPEGFRSIVDLKGFVIVPGLVDVHVHLREPGFSYKETIDTGTRAAARGGFTTVCAMPNVKPPPDGMNNLRVQLDEIERSAHVRVLPYGTITVSQAGEEPSDYANLSTHVAGFSDDGKGVQREEVMREAMRAIRAVDALVAAHCEDERFLTRGGSAHEGAFAQSHGLTGISSASEWKMVERDITLVRETLCRYHVCHVSTRQSVALIRAAKAEGLPVTCETAPHYLVLCDEDLSDHGRFKMNPPIRSMDDRSALLEGLLDGTIDMIATDHAPHSHEEKSGGFRRSVMGVVGLETSFAAMYTHLVLTGLIGIERLIEVMSLTPRRVFRLGGGIRVGEAADLCALDLLSKKTVNPLDFYSKGRFTPFEGMELTGDVKMTMVEGEIKWLRIARNSTES